MYVKATRAFRYRLNDRGDETSVPAGWVGHVPDAVAAKHADALEILSADPAAPGSESQGPESQGPDSQGADMGGPALTLRQEPRHLSQAELIAELVDVLLTEEFSEQETGRDGVPNIAPLKARLGARLGAQPRLSAADRSAALSRIAAMAAAGRDGDPPAEGPPAEGPPVDEPTQGDPPEDGPTETEDDSSAGAL